MISDEMLMEYLDGHLDAGQAKDVESALDDNPAVRARLKELEALDQKTRVAFDGLLQATPAHLVDLVRSSKAGAKALEYANTNVVELIRKADNRMATGAVARAWRQMPSWVGLAAAAQVTLLFVGAVLFQILPSRQDAPAASYQALASAPSSAAINLMVMWHPETPERQLRQDLELVGARIVGGPTASGAYLLHVSPQSRLAALDKLHHRQEVVLAEPVDAAKGRP